MTIPCPTGRVDMALHSICRVSDSSVEDSKKPNTHDINAAQLLQSLVECTIVTKSTPCSADTYM